MWPFKKKRTEPAYGDVKLVDKHDGSNFPYHIYTFTRYNACGGDEWYEWEEVETAETYGVALLKMNKIIYGEKDSREEVLSYFWNGGR